MANDDLETLPRPLAVAWGMYEAPQRGPKRELSHERIVEAAITMADRDGLGAVTMAKLAEALGFTTMSLYRYVTNKDELLALMQDEAARLDGVVEDQDWEQGLRDLVGLLLTNYRAHPWLTEVPISRQSLLMPNSLAVANQAMRAMRTLPLPQDDKLAIVLILTLLARSYAEMERDLGVEDNLADNPAVAELVATTITPERFSDLAPMLAAGGGYLDVDPGDPDEDITNALETVLLGIRERVKQNDAGTETANVSEGPSLTPAQTLAVAEQELAAAKQLRKQAQLRAKEMEKRVSAAIKQRDRAKAAANAAK